MPKPLIYVSGPYTKPDPAANVSKAMDVAHQILDRGGIPVVPHLSHFLHMHRQRPYEEWMDMDMELLERCDAIMRLKGHSPGADMEVARAKKLKIPMLGSLLELSHFVQLFE